MHWLPESLREKIIPEPMSGCWLWIDQIDSCGYGRVHFKNAPSRVRKNSFSDPLSRARQAHEYIHVALVIQIGWLVEASTEFFRTLLGVLTLLYMKYSKASTLEYLWR
jgi:hypothetical protein